MLVQERLNKLRELMKQHDMDAYIIVTDDYHGSEYVGDYFKEREFMSGFTGSAGTLVILPDKAYLWTGGRTIAQQYNCSDENKRTGSFRYTEIHGGMCIGSCRLQNRL